MSFNPFFSFFFHLVCQFKSPQFVLLPSWIVLSYAPQCFAFFWSIRSRGLLDLLAIFGQPSRTVPSWWVWRVIGGKWHGMDWVEIKWSILPWCMQIWFRCFSPLGIVRMLTWNWLSGDQMISTQLIPTWPFCCPILQISPTLSSPPPGCPHLLIVVM